MPSVSMVDGHIDEPRFKDKEIIKGLACCYVQGDCEGCPYEDYTLLSANCIKANGHNALELIKRLKADVNNYRTRVGNQREELARLNKQNDELTYKLWGVMHSVDKWLDGEELEQDEVNRACTMREKTLQITEQQQAEIEQWKEEANKYQKLWCEAEKDIQTAKSEAIKEFAERLKSYLLLNGSPLSVVFADNIDHIVAEMVGVRDVL